MDIFNDNVNSGDILRAETYQNLLNFAKRSSVAGGTVSADGISVPSEYTRSPRTVRFLAEENIKSYSIIELTEQIGEGKDEDNIVPTFKARPANGDSGALFYTGSSSAHEGCFGMAYSIGGEPIQIRSAAEADGTPQNGEIVEAAETEDGETAGGTFRYLGKSVSPDLKWFLPVQGGDGCAGVPSNPRIRIVQPKELFPACEYKSIQNVYGCTLEYSDDNMAWSVAYTFDIVGGKMVHIWHNPKTEPHKYWRIDLKGFAKSEEHEDRGFYTFGRLWRVHFDVQIVDNREPTYTLSPRDAEDAMDAGAFPWDSKPVPRKSQHHRLWALTFDEPEIVTKVELGVDQYIEHYIICPGGRDAAKQEIAFIYSFDLATETWTATTFPEMQNPMFNMDAKVVELEDGTHQLVILSGQISKGYSNIIQGYNFEKDYVYNAVDMGAGAINFAGRPALIGDPMLRGWDMSRPEGEPDFSRSLMVLGGGERSFAIRPPSTGTVFSDTTIFFVQGSTLGIGSPYEVNSLGINVQIPGHTGLPFGFFDITSQSGQSHAVVAKGNRQSRYCRHQNLPVRGILRRRPLGNTTFPTGWGAQPVVDFLLLGGFNRTGFSEFNDTVVSGMFGKPTPGIGNPNWYSMLTQKILDWSSSSPITANNSEHFLYYPDCPYVLGDCCAEYVEERDEIICFGGRPHENDTAVAHAALAVLEFEANSNAAQWKIGKYPPMPNPRWSAASVLIRGLLRHGEPEACDRIFIIGGRNRDGFVPEVDVFNLKHNAWETNWKGLDQGELEAIPPSMGGGNTTIIIQPGGGSNNTGIQSIRAGDGIRITGDARNPTISAVGFIWEDAE